VRFAAKEALVKAVGGRELSLKDIEVASHAGGGPFIKKQGKLGSLLFVRGVKSLHLSLSHEKEFGVAFVIAESDSP
jgi:holo-[acyl-carrier protein] synthase